MECLMGWLVIPSWGHASRLCWHSPVFVQVLPKLAQAFALKSGLLGCWGAGLSSWTPLRVSQNSAGKSPAPKKELGWSSRGYFHKIYENANFMSNLKI